MQPRDPTHRCVKSLMNCDAASLFGLLLMVCCPTHSSDPLEAFEFVLALRVSLFATLHAGS